MPATFWRAPGQHFSGVQRSTGPRRRSRMRWRTSVRRASYFARTSRILANHAFVATRAIMAMKAAHIPVCRYRPDEAPARLHGLQRRDKVVTFVAGRLSERRPQVE